MPVYGDGRQIWDWLYVEDHCSGILKVLHEGKPVKQYNIGGHNECTNLDIIKRLCSELEQHSPAADNEAMQARGCCSYQVLITFVEDRLGHDRRYAVDAGRIRNELRWQPAHRLADGIAKTVKWYIQHSDWCQAVTKGRYERQRLGVVS